MLQVDAEVVVELKELVWDTDAGQRERQEMLQP